MRTLRLTSPHMVGVDVKAAQNALKQAGYYYDKVDGEYGPVTAAAAANAITGAVGWQICISDSAAGANPNGMMAFWDTTHARWSYIHDNSAV